MGNYTQREAKVAIRRLNTAINEILSTSYATYQSKINDFNELSISNPIIESIIRPFKEIKVNFDEIHFSQNGFRIDEVRLPTDVNSRIAYLIQIFEKASTGEIVLEKYTHAIYRHKRFEDNIQEFMYDIARPQLLELIYILDDLLENEVDGKEVMTEAAFQLINHGSIIAHQGSNLALGKDIQQTVSNNTFSKELIEKIEGIEDFTDPQKSELKLLANEVQIEMGKTEPSPSRLKELAGKVYEIGENAALKVFTTVVSDPRWGQAAAETMLSIL